MTASRNKGDQAGQQARARSRGANQEELTGVKPTKSGSSGMTLFMSRVQKRTFDEIKDQAVRVGGAPAMISDIRKTPAQSMIVNMVVPANYQHELLDMMDACALGFAWIEFHFVPRRPFMPDVGGDELGADDAG